MHKFSTVARLLAGASAVAFVSVAALPAHAQTSTYSVTGQTPLQISLNQQRLGNGQLGNLQSLAQGNYTYNYVTVFFTPTTNVTNALFGVYEANFDPVSILYVGSFDPLNPSANAIIGNDDNSGLLAQAGITPIGCGGVCSAFTTNLTAGQTYYLFLSTYSSGTAFTTPVSFFATGTTVNWGTFVGTPTTTDIDTSSPSGFDAANLGSTLNPVFNGGTLYFTSGNNTYADNFRLAGNSGNALDVTGQINTLSGQLTDATSGGAIRFINSGTGGHIVLSGNSSYTGATTVETGADIRLTGSILNTSGMTVNNGGVFVVSNGGRLTAGALNTLAGGRVVVLQGGTLNDDMDNAGTYENAGTTNAIVNSNSGSILNDTTGVWTSQVHSNTGTLTNAGVWTGNIASSGTLVTTGTLNGTLSNSGTVQARGTITGAVTNAGSLTTTGSLTLNGTLSNSGTVSIGNGTSLTAGGVVNLSGGQVLIAQGGTLTDDLDTAGSVDNAGAANAIVNSNSGTILNRSTGVWTGQVRSNTGTFTNAGVWIGNIASSGTLVTTGTLNGTLSNSGTVQARGTITGAVTNTGSLTLIGETAFNGASITNSGTLNVNATTLNGAGNVTNAAVGTILVGTTAGAGHLTAGSLSNAGTVAMLNGRTGDTVTLSGAYSGAAGSVLTFDVDLSTGAADRLSAASLAGQSVVRLRNLGTAKTYLSAPIVLITAGSSTATFTASTDADTQSALSRNALISYDFRQLGGSSDWGIVSTLNTSGLSSLATGVSAFVTGQNLSLSDLPDSALNTSGTFGANQWMGHSWAETYTSQTDLRSAGTISDAYSLNGSSRAKALQDGSQYGFDAGVYNIGGSGMNLRAGILAGSTDGKSRDSELFGAVTTYDVPHYGYYVILNSAGLRLSVQNRHDLLRLKVSNPVLSLSGAALKGRGDTLSATVAGLNTLGRYVVEPSAGYVESLIDLDALALPNGMGSVEVARLKSQAYHAGIKVSTTFSGRHVLWQPYGELSGWKETAADTQTAYRPGSDSAPVWIGGQRLDTFAQASIGVAAQMRTHPDLTGFLKANAHSGDRLESWSIRAGVSYRLH
jgi:cytoskeletal protein CcmA (bactofilin family)